jgi:XTP/dITP diphosphohydrolase
MTDLNSSKQNSLVLASGNRGKLAEFQQLLQGVGFAVVPQTALQVPDIEETGLSFVENAILKARNAARHTLLPALADDSGLEVDALRGAPGIYSARFAGLGASDAQNNAKLLELLRDTPESERSARFRCVLVFMRHAEDPSPVICEGAWNGRILNAPRGEKGFGYDPLFFVPEQKLSAAELPAELKNRISHRGQAMAKLLESLRLILMAHSFAGTPYRE